MELNPYHHVECSAAQQAELRQLLMERISVLFPAEKSRRFGTKRRPPDAPAFGRPGQGENYCVLLAEPVRKVPAGLSIRLTCYYAAGLLLFEYLDMECEGLV